MGFIADLVMAKQKVEEMLIKAGFEQTPADKLADVVVKMGLHRSIMEITMPPELDPMITMIIDVMFSNFLKAVENEDVRAAVDSFATNPDKLVELFTAMSEILNSAKPKTGPVQQPGSSTVQ